ncbi:MAG: Holliday junction branch migration protein RuvA [Kiritimatiellia bacterium]
MIECISGRLVEKSPTHAVIQTGGIGFHLPIPLSSYDALPLPGEEVKLFTYLVVREDSLTLYGFAGLEDRGMFERLIQVSGIGPKLALTALSGLPLRDLKRAIADGDVKRLSSISGIGKKMAERMVVELRDKLGAAETLELRSGDPGLSSNLRDAILALVALGYKQQEARKLLEKVQQTSPDNLEVEELVRKALSGS